MIQRLQNIFVRVTGNTDFIITANTKLKTSEITLSSFTIIQLFCELEDEFDIEIPNSVIKRMKTVGDILAYLQQQNCT